MRYLVYWGFRRDQLCDRKIGCPHEDARATCPLDSLEAAQATELGQLIKRAVEIKTALKFGFHMDLDDISSDEFEAMKVIEEEVSKFENEKNGADDGRQ